MEIVFQHPLFKLLIVIVLTWAVLPLAAGYVSLLERKVLGDIQVRLGPMRVGPHGLYQPVADAFKLIIKEDVIPAQADQKLFWLAPVFPTFAALTSFSVIPISGAIYGADVNVGLLIVLAMSAMGVIGIILGGWASNSHYPLLGSLRSAAQLVSYEVALSLALISGVMMAGTLSMVGIVKAQQARHVWFAFDNYGLMIVPFFMYVVAAIAETNRSPFDLPEAESELVGGFHTEYTGFRFALYFLGEYANVMVVSSVAVTLFMGGWLRPFPNVGWLEYPLNFGFPFAALVGTGIGCLPLARRLKCRIQQVVLVGVGLLLILCAALFLVPAVNQVVIGPFWFLLKMGSFVYAMIWIRGTFPRFRYDQLMNLSWKYMIPTGMGAILVNAVVGVLRAH